MGDIPTLAVLNVSSNRLKSLAGLEGSPLLRVLDVKHNFLSDMDELNYLKTSELLSELHIEGNTALIRESAGSRMHAIARLQQLNNLDGVHVTPEDKVKAINALDFPGHERPNRIKTWHEVFGDDFAGNAFVDKPLSLLDGTLNDHAMLSMCEEASRDSSHSSAEAMDVFVGAGGGSQMEDASVTHRMKRTGVILKRVLSLVAHSNEFVDYMPPLPSVGSNAPTIDPSGDQSTNTLSLALEAR